MSVRDEDRARVIRPRPKPQKPSLAAVHAEIERLIELAVEIGGGAWYERQLSRWAGNRPSEAAKAEGVEGVGAKRRSKELNSKGFPCRRASHLA